MTKAEPKKRSGNTLNPNEIFIMPGRNQRDRLEDGNYREHAELVAYIIENGVRKMPPIRVCLHEGKYYVTAGHRRMEAIREAISKGCDIVNIPVDMDDHRSNESDHLLTQISENSGVRYTELELGRCIRKYLDYGHDLSYVSKKSGREVAFLKKCLDLTYAPAEVQAMIVSGEMAVTTAVNLIRDNGTGEAAIAVVKAAKATGKKITGDVIKGVVLGDNTDAMVEYLAEVPWAVLDAVTLDKIVKLIKKAEKNLK